MAVPKLHFPGFRHVDLAQVSIAFGAAKALETPSLMASLFNYFNNHYVRDAKAVCTKKDVHGSDYFSLHRKEKQTLNGKEKLRKEVAAA